MMYKSVAIFPSSLPMRPRARLNLTPNLLYESGMARRTCIGNLLYFSLLNTLRDYDLIAEKRSLKKSSGQ